MNLNACSRSYRDLPATMHYGATARIRAVPEDLSFGLWAPCVVLEVLERPFHRYASKPALEHSQGVCMLAEGVHSLNPAYSGLTYAGTQHLRSLNSWCGLRGGVFETSSSYPGSRLHAAEWRLCSISQTEEKVGNRLSARTGPRSHP